MPDEPQAVRVAVYIDSPEARKLAEEVLEPLEHRQLERFSGVAEGWLAPAEASRLSEAGLVVELVQEREPGLPTPSEVSPVSGDPADALSTNAELVEELKQQSSKVRFSEDEGHLEVGAAPAEHDPRLHRFAAEPSPEQALPEDVFNIDIPVPIARAQRLELDALGVDIAAFEPGIGYRAFLTPEQQEAVRKLPYVAGLTRYSFEHVLTPELLEVVSEESGPPDGADEEPSLMSADEQGEARPQVFDCLLHREEDLSRILALIDRSPETTIIENSNLRVRFSAEVDVPFLSALAALPEVRKLAPYEAPTL